MSASTSFVLALRALPVDPCHGVGGHRRQLGGAQHRPVSPPTQPLKSRQPGFSATNPPGVLACGRGALAQAWPAVAAAVAAMPLWRCHMSSGWPLEARPNQYSSRAAVVVLDVAVTPATPIPDFGHAGAQVGNRSGPLAESSRPAISASVQTCAPGHAGRCLRLGCTGRLEVAGERLAETLPDLAVCALV